MARDSAAPCLSDRATGMALSVLAEIGRMLEALSESGQAGAIDLRSLPLLDIAGESEVWETTYPGVWWICHRGADSKIATEEISVCAIPEILITHPVDIKAAAGRLREELETTHV